MIDAANADANSDANSDADAGVDAASDAIYGPQQESHTSQHTIVIFTLCCGNVFGQLFRSETALVENDKQD